MTDNEAYSKNTEPEVEEASRLLGEAALKSGNDEFEHSRAQSLEALALELGFAETDSLTLLREQAIAAIEAADLDYARSLRIKYIINGRQLVEQLQGEEFQIAQLGLSIKMALIKRESGMQYDHEEDLRDLERQAYGQRLEQVEAALLEKIRESKPDYLSTRDLLNSKELSHTLENTFDLETCQEISLMGMEEGLGYVFTLLLDKGIDDPEAFLVELGVLEPPR